jgi:hypothetical protein
MSPFPDGLDWNTWQSIPWEYDENEHPTAWTGRETVKYISDYSFEKPLFMKASFHRPHSPYDAPERLLGLVDDKHLHEPRTGASWDEQYRNHSGCDTSDAWCGQKNHTEQ